MRAKRSSNRGRLPRGAGRFDAQRVEEHLVGDLVPLLPQAGGERFREMVHARGDAHESLRSVPDRVEPAHHRQQYLCRADVARGLLAADVLLARAERHPERRAAGGVPRDADQAPRHVALVLVLRGEERRVRPAVAHRHAKTLHTADRDVRPPLPGRDQQRERKQVRRDHHERAGSAHARAERAAVLDGAEGVRVLQQHAAHARVEREVRRRRDGHGDAARPATRLDHGNGLRMAIVRHEKGVAPGVDRVRELHRLGGGRRLVEQRGVRDRQRREFTDDRLIVEQRLEASLRDFRLVRRVGRVPARVLEHVALDHGGRVRRVVTEADEAAPDLVRRDHRLEGGQRLLLGHGRGKV